MIAAFLGKDDYRPSTFNDVNAFFAFLLDAVVNLFVLSALLQIFGFPQDLIDNRIIPGAIVGIVAGNLLYVWLGYRRAKKTGNHDITAIPLGLDLTTTVGFTLSVIGPLFLMLEGQLGDPAEAGRIAWYVGMASTIWMALVKLGASYVGGFIQRTIPIAALVGSMFGIAIVWLGANAIMGIFELPHIGLIALVVMIFALIGGRALPFNMPGAVVAIGLSTLVYYGLGLSGGLDALGYSFQAPSMQGTGLGLPAPTLGWTSEFFGLSLNYMAIIIPFGVLIAASSINIVAAAKLVDDDYQPGNVIRVDAAATAISAMFGGIIQTTPYFGHATYKRMGARIGYSAAAAGLLLVGGLLGVISILIDIIPSAAIKPILIVVASAIVRLGFGSIPKDHGPAVMFATMPAIINYCYVNVSTLFGHVNNALAPVRQGLDGARTAAGQLVDTSTLHVAQMVPAHWMNEYILLGAMARGYILTGLLWATIVVFLVDREHLKAVLMLMIASACSYFGVIHSVMENSAIYLPWQLHASMEGLQPGALGLPQIFAGSYFLAAMVVLVLYLMRDMGMKPEQEGAAK